MCDPEQDDDYRPVDVPVLSTMLRMGVLLLIVAVSWALAYGLLVGVLKLLRAVL